MLTNVEIKVTHLKNKFWTHNSVKVPNVPVRITNDFVTLEDIWRTKQQQEFSLIQWDEFMIAGRIMLPGEWNYCYVQVKVKEGDRWVPDRGAFFHLEKISTNGFIKGEHECFFYQLIYDDWQNDWLTNRIYLKGSINLTGDKKLVRNNIVQTTPLINNVNSFTYYNGFLGEYENIGRVILPEVWLYTKKLNKIFRSQLNEINNLLSNFNYEEPNPDKLVIPLIYRFDSVGDWKYNIISSLRKLTTGKLEVFDIGFQTEQHASFRPVLESKLNSDEIYAVALKSNSSYFFAKAVNETKYVTKVDLSNAENLQELDSVTLQPFYREKFSFNKLVNDLTRRMTPEHWEMKEDVKEDFKRVMTKILMEMLIQPFIDVTRTVDRVYKNVELVDIHQRDMIYSAIIGRDTVQFQNPHWLYEIDLIPTRRYVKNGVFDETTQPVDKSVITGFDGDIKSFKDRLDTWKYSIWRWCNNNRQQCESIKYNSNILDCVNYTLPISPLQKMVDSSGKEIDFSYNTIYGTRFIALIPDYKRKCHVLAISRDHELHNLRWNPSVNNINSYSKLRIISFDEVVHREDTTEIDINKPSDLLPIYQKLVRNGEVLLRPWENFKGIVQMSLQTPRYAGVVVYKHYYSRDVDNQYINYRCTNSNKNISYAYQSGCLYYRTSDLISKQGRNITEESLVYINIPKNIEHHDITQIVENIKNKWVTINEQWANESRFKYKIHGTDKGYGTIKKYIKIVDGKPTTVSEDEISTDTITILIDPQQWRSPGHHLMQQDGGLPHLVRLLDNYFRVSMPLLTKGEGQISDNPTDLKSPKYDYFELFMIKAQDALYSFIKTCVIFPTVDTDRNTFANLTPNGWNNLSGQYLISVIPNPTRDSAGTWVGSAVIPKYYYVVDPSEVDIYNNPDRYNSDVVLALLYRRGDLNWGQDSYEVYDAGAKVIYDEFNTHVAGKHNLLFNNFIRSRITTERTNNPTKFDDKYVLKLHNGTSLDLPYAEIDELIPPFMTPYLQPTSILNDKLHKLKHHGVFVDDTFIELFRGAVENAIIAASTKPIWYDIVGTQWYVVLKLSFREGRMVINHELFSTNPQNIKTKKAQKWLFKNVDGNQDVDVMINSTYELNLYGNRIGLKTRDFGDEEIIDMNLEVTPIDDPRQSITAIWYHVQMSEFGQDTIRMVAETPKEIVRIHDMSPYERERMIREISLKSVERNAQIELLQAEKDAFKNNDAAGHAHSFGRAFTRIASAGIDLLTAWNPTKWLGEGRFGGGRAQMWQSGISMGSGLFDYLTETGHRVRGREIAMNKFSIRGNLMRETHETEQKNQLERLMQMSSKITYPETTSKLVYKLVNPLILQGDVYLVRYYPSGSLLEYIKNYYLEYGYEILVRDFVCRGNIDITRHIRFAHIHVNIHPLERIRAMIEERALTGIYAIDWEQESWNVTN